MRYASKLYVPFESWPEQDRRLWEAAFAKGDNPFEDSGPAAHLAEASRLTFRDAYARHIAFLTARHSHLLARPPAERLDRAIIADYVKWQPATTGARTIANNLYWLGITLRYMGPGKDWSWLFAISNRIAAQAKRKPEKKFLVTGDILYSLGVTLMDRASSSGEHGKTISKNQALLYRNGLLISLLAAIPLRLRALSSLRIGKHLVRVGGQWALDIPAQLDKIKRAHEYPIPARLLSQRIDLYLNNFRSRIPGAITHDFLWASNSGQQMTAGHIEKMVRRHTLQALGFSVNPHRFRNAAATLWSIRDPANVRGTKDLLGHASFSPTEKYYITAHSRLAGRALARAIDSVRKGPVVS
jgi:integrase/recombinase XerD